METISNNKHAYFLLCDVFMKFKKADLIDTDWLINWEPSK